MYSTTKAHGNSTESTNQLNINHSGHKAKMTDAVKNKKTLPTYPETK